MVVNVPVLARQAIRLDLYLYTNKMLTITYVIGLIANRIDLHI